MTRDATDSISITAECEWKYWGDDIKDPVYTISCGRNIIYNKLKDEKYCPYCGKPIKVVE